MVRVIGNGDFENGLSGWRVVSGMAFAYRPILAENIGAFHVMIDGRPPVSLGGDFWYTTAYPLGHHGSSLIRIVTRAQGMLDSDPFTISARYLAWGQPMSEVWADVQQPERHIYRAAPRSGEDWSLLCNSGCYWSIQGSFQVRAWSAPHAEGEATRTAARRHRGPGSMCDPRLRSSSVRRAGRYCRASGPVGAGRRTEQLGEQRPEHGARVADGPDNPLALIVPIGVPIGQQPDAHAARVAPCPDHDDAGFRRLHAVIVSGERVKSHQSSIGSGTSAAAAGGYDPVLAMPPRRPRP